MELPVQVTFRDIDVSEAMREVCGKEVDKLERFHDRLTSCRIVIATPHRHHNKGALFSVSIDLTYPGGEIVVNRDHHENHAHEDAYVAIHDSFKIARRQLEDHVRRRRGETKSHETPRHGHVRKLVDDGFGFIETSDGRELYFHRNSVLDGGYDQLRVGSEVRFVEEQGDDGPQASSVRLVGRHHIVP